MAYYNTVPPVPGIDTTYYNNGRNVGEWLNGMPPISSPASSPCGEYIVNSPSSVGTNPREQYLPYYPPPGIGNMNILPCDTVRVSAAANGGGEVMELGVGAVTLSPYLGPSTPGIVSYTVRGVLQLDGNSAPELMDILGVDMKELENCLPPAIQAARSGDQPKPLSLPVYGERKDDLNSSRAPCQNEVAAPCIQPCDTTRFAEVENLPNAQKEPCIASTRYSTILAGSPRPLSVPSATPCNRSTTSCRPLPVSSHIRETECRKRGVSPPTAGGRSISNLCSVSEVPSIRNPSAIGSQRSNLIPQESVVSQRSNLIPQESVVSQRSNLIPQGSLVSQRSNLNPQGSLVSQRSNLIPQESVISQKGNLIPQESVVSQRGNLIPTESVCSQMSSFIPQESVISQRSNLIPQESVFSQRSNFIPPESIVSVNPQESRKSHVSFKTNLNESFGGLSTVSEALVEAEHSHEPSASCQSSVAPISNVVHSTTSGSIYSDRNPSVKQSCDEQSRRCEAIAELESPLEQETNLSYQSSATHITSAVSSIRSQAAPGNPSVMPSCDEVISRCQMESPIQPEQSHVDHTISAVASTKSRDPYGDQNVSENQSCDNLSVQSQAVTESLHQRDPPPSFHNSVAPMASTASASSLHPAEECDDSQPIDMMMPSVVPSNVAPELPAPPTDFSEMKVPLSNSSGQRQNIAQSLKNDFVQAPMQGTNNRHSIDLPFTLSQLEPNRKSRLPASECKPTLCPRSIPKCRVAPQQPCSPVYNMAPPVNCGIPPTPIIPCGDNLAFTDIGGDADTVMAASTPFSKRIASPQRLPPGMYTPVNAPPNMTNFARGSPKNEATIGASFESPVPPIYGLYDVEKNLGIRPLNRDTLASRDPETSPLRQMIEDTQTYLFERTSTTIGEASFLLPDRQSAPNEATGFNLPKEELNRSQYNPAFATELPFAQTNISTSNESNSSPPASGPLTPYAYPREDPAYSVKPGNVFPSAAAPVAIPTTGGGGNYARRAEQQVSRVFDSNKLRAWVMGVLASSCQGQCGKSPSDCQEHTLKYLMSLVASWRSIYAQQGGRFKNPDSDAFFTPCANPK